SIPRVMWSVVIALVPAMAASIYFFGISALTTISVSVISAISTEAIIQRLRHKPITISDGSAVVTGILLALVLPPRIPCWMVIIGSFCAIALAKQLFGGLGYNIFNPALVGRAILLASFPIAMTTWRKPFEAVTCATPLTLIKERICEGLPSYWELFIGKVGGSLGETSVLALLIGAVFLLLRGYISWHIPLSCLGTVALLTAILNQDPLFHLLTGGLILGAFFMATDMVTTPLTKKGKLVFGIGVGIIVVVIRLKGGYPEGVCYSILLMNAFTPLIDRWIKPKVFGKK
ncbi:RnfABCDGE type electron transport complex subunit D, partial [bacterium]|nr:RnfABCDGE type electron transport complex subunit D [bacterium]